MSTSPKPKPKRRYYTTPEGKRRMVRCLCNLNTVDLMQNVRGFDAIYINEGKFDNICSVCGKNFFYIDGKLETPSE